jgi:glycosyltransferase involved in cell wall biosynthesis
MPVDMSLRSELGIRDADFVVLYSGNMGYTMSDLGTVIDAARLLEGEKSVRFVLAGDGVRRQQLEKLANGLNNVTFLPIQSRDRYQRLLASANVCLVVLDREGTRASVPSKTYNIMAAGRPVLALCESDNEISLVVREANCGVQVPPSDARALAQAIRNYRECSSVAVSHGRNARSYFERHYTPEIGISQYEHVFAELCGQSDVQAERDEAAAKA